ncbi:glycosyltransferase family 2 protein [Winogradskyella sp.]|uniref:glycosyltransferase family 2 protein n=1 Tax=Winogradskyella sp. TaxID=1883156 RepID=UPI003BAA25A6
MNPSFSVVISVYNKEEHIKKTIDSVLNQTYDNFEIILVNDGSTDNSLEVINSIKDDRIKVISTKNQGASECRNTGIKGASKNYIALLDGDDLWDEEFLEYIQRSILQYPNKMVFSTAIAHKHQNKTVSAIYSFKQQELTKVHNFFESSLNHTILTGSSIVFKREILNTTGYFNPSIVSGQDTDLWIRIGMHYDIVFINKILAYYNYVSGSLSNTTFDISKKPKFDNYLEEETKNKSLKIYIDRNRFPLAILSKLQNNKERFCYYKKSIDPKNLPLRQRVFLKLPKWCLKLLLKLKSLNGKKLYYPTN